MPVQNATSTQRTDSTGRGKPSDLARRVTEAFQSAAKDAVAVNRARGNTVVGEVNGQWRVEKKTSSP